MRIIEIESVVVEVGEDVAGNESENDYCRHWPNHLLDGEDSQDGETGDTTDEEKFLPFEGWPSFSDGEDANGDHQRDNSEDEEGSDSHRQRTPILNTGSSVLVVCRCWFNVLIIIEKCHGVAEEERGEESGPEWRDSALDGEDERG